MTLTSDARTKRCDAHSALESSRFRPESSITTTTLRAGRLARSAAPECRKPYKDAMKMRDLAGLAAKHVSNEPFDLDIPRLQRAIEFLGNSSDPQDARAVEILGRRYRTRGHYESR